MDPHIHVRFGSHAHLAMLPLEHPLPTTMEYFYFFKKSVFKKERT